jgi:hypothetical protein
MDALPPDVRQEVVMSAAAIDGHTITTHRFRSAQQPEALLANLRARWRDDGFPVVETRQGDWTILSVRDATGMHTVQLRATAGGTEGLSSRWVRNGAHEPGQTAATVSGAVELPVLQWLGDDARVVRRVMHRDHGRNAVTVVALVAEGTDRAAARLRERARAAGFEDDPALGLPAARAAWYRGGPSMPGQALAFRRGREEVVATVSVHRADTALVLHWSAPR